MIIFDNNSKPLILDNINTPTLTDYFWVLDLLIQDFTLAPLLVLEEIVASSIELCINGFKFVLPSNWNILIVDIETSQLDIVDIASTAGREFEAFIYGPTEPRFETATIYVTNYCPNWINVGPSLNKSQMLCHPINPLHWVNVGPSDMYNKFLKNLVAGDLI